MPSDLSISSKAGLAFSEPEDFCSHSRRDMELRDVLQILQRRKFIVLLLFVLGIVLGGASGLFAAREFSSTATVEVNKQQENALGLRDLSGNSSASATIDDLNNDLLTQQAVIMSDNIAMRVIEKLRLYKYPPYLSLMNGDDAKLGQAPLRDDKLLRMFKSRLNVSLVKGTRLIEITYRDPDPVRSSQVANAIVDSYMTDYTQSRFQASTKASSWLATQLADLKNKVAESQTKVEKYQQESGLVGMSMTGHPGDAGLMTSANSIPVERLIELNHDLTSAEVSRIAKEAVYRTTQTQDPDAVLGSKSSTLAQSLGADTVLSPGNPDVALLQQLRQQQGQLQVQIVAAASKYGERNPILIRLHDQETAQAEQIQTEMGRIRAQAKNDFTMASLATSAIRGRIAAQEQQVQNISAKSDQLLLLQQEANSNRNLYQDLYTKLQEATVAAGINASKVTPVDPGRVPVQPSSLRELTRLEMGGALGLICGLLSACLWDYSDESISTPAQIAEVTSIRMLGVIPDFPSKRKPLPTNGARMSIGAATSPNAWLVHAPQSHISEAYRGLRTALLVSKRDTTATVVAVLSGAPQEGKSSTCFNTASAFAIQGNRVLYVDADMRRPFEGRIVDWPERKGLSDYLSGSVPLTEAIHRSADVDSLSILPAGAIPKNPAELIGSLRFRQMLDQLRKQYDYVFLDSPPLLLVADGQMLSLYADGYLLVLRAGKTTKSALRSSLSVLENSRARPLGVVLNGMNTRVVGYPMYRNDKKGSNYYGETPQFQA
ncbi:capsular exopolysaccharide family [Terriglobus roseus]|uniref:non-specific protein-tyrosine kinase n=2 Tax=Terriglobus roseus TaxID=392734 RepID=A0A1H4IZ95_9BACT|nr:capsular exopolysaccharide family [Terriglobus roseus]